MNNELLYYKAPAKNWVEALPLGNGSLGAMCYSGLKTDRISLNHDTLWTGHPRTVTRDGAYKAYLTAQKAALNNDYKKAQEEIEKGFLTCWSQAYMPFGDLTLDFGFRKGENYSRVLNLKDAVLTSSFVSSGQTIKKTAFVS